MTDEKKNLLDFLRPLLPITPELEHPIIKLRNKMVVEKEIRVKIILERNDWKDFPNESNIVVTIDYLSGLYPYPMKASYKIETLWDAICTMNIMPDDDIYLGEGIAIDKDGNIVEDATPPPNVLASLNTKPVK